MNPTRAGRGRSRVSQPAAAAAEAAVRVALMTELSRQATGYPVAGSLRMSTAEARGSPEATLSGKLEIHFSPSTGEDPPSEAGSAMIPVGGRAGGGRRGGGGRAMVGGGGGGGKRGRWGGGWAVFRGWGGGGGASTIWRSSFSGRGGARCTCAPGTTANDGTDDGALIAAA